MKGGLCGEKISLTAALVTVFTISVVTFAAYKYQAVMLILR